MTALYIISGVLFGIVLGISYAMKATERHINKADICDDDKRFIRGVLGIPQAKGSAK